MFLLVVIGLGKHENSVGTRARGWRVFLQLLEFLSKFKLPIAFKRVFLQLTSNPTTYTGNKPDAAEILARAYVLRAVSFFS